MDPKELREWIRAARDLVIVCVSTFMLVFEVVFRVQPNLGVIAAALSLLGLPPIFRLDEWIRRDTA